MCIAIIVAKSTIMAHKHSCQTLFCCVVTRYVIWCTCYFHCVGKITNMRSITIIFNKRCKCCMLLAIAYYMNALRQYCLGMKHCYYYILTNLLPRILSFYPNIRSTNAWPFLYNQLESLFSVSVALQWCTYFLIWWNEVQNVYVHFFVHQFDFDFI